MNDLQNRLDYLEEKVFQLEEQLTLQDQELIRLDQAVFLQILAFNEMAKATWPDMSSKFDELTERMFSQVAPEPEEMAEQP